jgi:hypothetical protein
MAIYANITIDQGSDYEALVEVEAADGSAADLNGYTARGQMRKTYGSLTSFDLGATVADPDNGTVRIFMSHELTSTIKAGRYVYDIEVVSDNGSVVRVIEGQVEVTPNVTR